MASDLDFRPELLELPGPSVVTGVVEDLGLEVGRDSAVAHARRSL